MNFRLYKRESFSVCGYCVETCLETCGIDLTKLWQEFDTKKKELFDLFGIRDDFYGVMWKTSNDRYCYLIGIEADAEKARGTLPEGSMCKHIPSAEYAVVSVPSSLSAVDAWTEFYYKVLPEVGYSPNAEHGTDFEYYPNDGNGTYELWTPVKKSCLA